MEKGYADNLIETLNMVLGSVDESRREIMKQWAHREMTQRPLITRASARQWVNSYVDEESKRTVPAGYHTLAWEVGKPSPSFPAATIFAMVQVDDDHVKVFSFGVVEHEGKDANVYFHETIFRPDVTFGPISADALFEEWSTLFATEDELEKLELRGHANGAAS